MTLYAEFDRDTFGKVQRAEGMAIGEKKSESKIAALVKKLKSLGVSDDEIEKVVSESDEQ